MLLYLLGEVLDLFRGLQMDEGPEVGPPEFRFPLTRADQILEFHEQGLVGAAQTGVTRVRVIVATNGATEVEDGEGIELVARWGSYVDRYPHAHFAASIANYELLEAAPAEVPGLIDDGWALVDGCLSVPETPGCGFDVDAKIFEQALLTGEAWRVTTSG